MLDLCDYILSYLEIDFDLERARAYNIASVLCPIPFQVKGNKRCLNQIDLDSCSLFCM